MTPGGSWSHSQYYKRPGALVRTVVHNARIELPVAPCHGGFRLAVQGFLAVHGKIVDCGPGSAMTRMEPCLDPAPCRMLGPSEELGDSVETAGDRADARRADKYRRLARA